MSKPFTPQQVEIIENFGQGQAVVAGAGCGKTTTLVAKVLALLKSKPEARFCAVSFTEKSVRDLRASLGDGLQSQSINWSPRHHWVKTIHGLCYTVLQDFPVFAGLNGGERIATEDESRDIWQQSLTPLWSQNENEEISKSIALLLELFSKDALEALLDKVRSLVPFGVEDFIHHSFHREDVKAIWLVFESVYHRYQHAKERVGVLDFNDLETLASRALEEPTVRRFYHDKFELLLVDEFQDTNPVQGRILEAIAKPNFSNLCVVGDPKQSIYRFRDADVSVFTDLIEKLPRKHLLTTNYRSRPEILEFVNQICEPLFQASELDYEPLVPGRDGSASDERSSSPRVVRLEVESEQQLAGYLKSQERLGIDLSEYVILARSIRKGGILKQLSALESAGIPFMLGSGGRFYSDPRVQETVAFLRGWISPNHRLSQVAALRAPWVGVDEKSLQEWKDHVYFEQFFKNSAHPVAQALSEDYLKKNLLRPGEILERLWDLEEMSEEMRLPLATLWHKAESLSSQGKRFEDVVQAFSDAIQNELIDQEIPPPSSQGVVRVLTVHASKGLQFPRVILLDFTGAPARGRSSGLIWNRRRGIHFVNRDETGLKEKKDPENIEWAEQEKSAAVAESKRVFYVAATRPQEQLILVAQKRDPLKLKEPLVTDNWRAWIDELAPHLLVETPSSEVDSNPVKATVVEKPARKKFDLSPYRARHSASEWLVLLQCGLRYRERYLSESAPFVEPSKNNVTEATDPHESTGMSASEQGSRLHQWLELEDWEALSTEFQDPEQVSKLQEHLTVGPSVDVFRELAFEAPFDAHEALVGVMDRLEVNREAKTIKIVDYKWTMKAKTPEELLATYSSQLKLYVWAALSLIDFNPTQISAELIHFTQNTIRPVEVPAEILNPEEIMLWVRQVHGQAQAVLKEFLANTQTAPQPGDHCRHCEFKTRCPAF